MMSSRFYLFLCLLGALCQIGQAFVVVPPSSVTSRTARLPILAGMAQPEVEIKTKVTTKQKEKTKQHIKQKNKTDEPVRNRDEDFEDAPMYKLLLIGDDSYDPEHVITRMMDVVGEELDEDQAATCFKQAMAAGKAMCGKYPFERAELFKEQFLRSDPMIFADLEEENA